MRPRRGRLAPALAVAGALALSAPAAAVAATPTDFGTGGVLNILPPGQAGGLPVTGDSTSQIALYDGLTPLLGNVTAADVGRLYKSARFGLGSLPGRPAEVTGRPGLQIVRDQRFGVPHITGATRADVEFGAGWVTAEDRGIFIEAIRGPARLAALDAPGLNAVGIAGAFRKFEGSAATERFLADQITLLRRSGPTGRQVVADTDSFVAGVNAYLRSTGSPNKPWTRNDVLACAALIAAIFGTGGGNEVAGSQFLAALRSRLGPAAGTRAFRDLKQVSDPDAPTSIPTRFTYDPPPTGATPGSLVVDPGSASAAARRATTAFAAGRRSMSNALLVGARRSAGGHPIAVMGPQVGYRYPQFLMEMDIHGGGLDARGAAFPGASLYVILGRGRDFAWSATASGSDIVDEFLEQLCNADGSAPTRASTSYRYRGRCRPMGTFDAGTLRGPDQKVVFKTTVHGPVAGTATVRGRPYAIVRRRSTRGREVASFSAFAQLNVNAVRSAKDFVRVMNGVEFTFNWHYADDRDIAFFSSGRLPVRAAGVDPSLPTLGTGPHDWKGFLSGARHPQAINPAGGVLVNWNNKPAPGFGASDSNWHYGSVHRSQLLRGFKARNRVADVVSVMNRAATQDLRALDLWPVVRRVLAGGPAPDARSRQAADLITTWQRAGASRIDSTLDGKVDAPGAAVMDAAWKRIATAVLAPVLGPLTADLARLDSIDNAPNDQGSAFNDGWYSYVDKDLRTLLGDPVRRRYSRRYCGGGDLAVCRASLWAAVQAAADELAAAQGTDPAAWRADATRERIVFSPGLLGPANTMRWTNRPTFQQVVEFRSHRPR